MAPPIRFEDFVKWRSSSPATQSELTATPEARFALFPLYRADGVVMTRDLVELMLLYLDADPPDVAKNRELAAHIQALLT